MLWWWILSEGPLELAIGALSVLPGALMFVPVEVELISAVPSCQTPIVLQDRSRPDSCHTPNTSLIAANDTWLSPRWTLPPSHHLQHIYRILSQTKVKNESPSSCTGMAVAWAFLSV